MNCKEFEKLIPEFSSGKMSYLTLKRFCEHVEACESCKEELTITILVTEGIHRLEDGSAFDIQAEMRRRMNEAKYRIHSSNQWLRVAIALDVIALCVIIAVIIGIFL